MDVDFKQISLNIKRRAYRCLGIGSGRTVFDLANGSVVKVAWNIRGIAQNQTEYEIGSKADTELFAKVLEISKDFRFLIMEKAERLQGISFVWNYFNVKGNKELHQVAALKEISEKFGLLLGDFGRSVNWGKINEKPVIVDYGFTRNVKRRFYR